MNLAILTRLYVYTTCVRFQYLGLGDTLIIEASILPHVYRAWILLVRMYFGVASDSSLPQKALHAPG